MIDIPEVYLIIFGLAVFSIISLCLNLRLWWTGRSKDREADSRVRGASVTRGLIAEQFAPFTKAFEKLGWDLQEFKFLGRPVDGVQFEEDEIIIVEFKTGNAPLSQKQRRIKELVERGKVSFKEVRF